MALQSCDSDEQSDALFYGKPETPRRDTHEAIKKRAPYKPE